MGTDHVSTTPQDKPLSSLPPSLPCIHTDVPVVHQQHEEFHSQDSEDSGYSSNTSHYTPQKKRRGTYSSLFERPTTLLLNSRPGATEEGGRGMMYPSPETTPHNRTELVIGRGEFTPLNNSRLVVSYSSIPTTPSSDKPAGFFKQLSAPPITGKRRDNNNRELWKFGMARNKQQSNPHSHHTQM